MDPSQLHTAGPLEVCEEIEVDGELTVVQVIETGELQNAPYIVVPNEPAIAQGEENPGAEGLQFDSTTRFTYETHEGKRRGSTIYSFNKFEYVKERTLQHRIPVK